MILKTTMPAEKMNFLSALREMDRRLNVEETPLKSPELKLEDVNRHCNQNVDLLCSAIKRIEEGDTYLGFDTTGWITECIAANYSSSVTPNVCALITGKFRERIETVLSTTKIRFDGLNWNSARRVFSFEFFRTDQNLSIMIRSCHDYDQRIEVRINVRKLKDQSYDPISNW